MQAFGSAIAFLTVIPVPARWNGVLSARSVALFPAVGLIIGGALLAVDFAFASFPMLVRSIVVVATWILLTGALHVDGWIDACDAMAPGLAPEKALAAMKDSRAGAMGAAGAVVLISAKWGAMTSILDRRGAWIMIAVVVSRWAVVAVMWAFPYGSGRDGIGWSPTRDLTLASVVVATLTLAVLIPFAGYLPVAAALGLAALASGTVISVLRRRLGHVSGDAYGAAVELSEVVVLILGSRGAWV